MSLVLNVFEWVLKIVGLNLIGLLWSILDKKLTAKWIYSREDLIDRIQEEWIGIDKDLCMKLAGINAETN